MPSTIVRIFLFALTLSLFPPVLQALQQDLPAPPGSSALYGSQVTILPNGNIVVVDRDYSIPGGATNVGAVYLLSGADLSVISTLTGSNNDDFVGSGGVHVVKDGNFVVASRFWNGNRGAVTWCSGTTGRHGIVTADNSLIGLGPYVVGSSVTVLTNGNYVVATPFNASGFGAVTWGNGSIGTVGTVGSHNSMVGGNSTDRIGSGGIIPLSNGNYVIASPEWNSGCGAATWCNGSTSSSGFVSGINSIVGTEFTDKVGGEPRAGRPGVVPLTNGHYVVVVRNWSVEGFLRAGAVRWCNGTQSTGGQITQQNAFIGNANDAHLGDGGVFALTNGNYVICSPDVNFDGRNITGAVTWRDGSGPSVGILDASNSLLGANAHDSLGSGGVTALNNGNYVIISPDWGNWEGAATWGAGHVPITGIANASNSLVGAINDQVASAGVVALTNGNYVVRSPSWSNGAIGQVGAATWGNGSTGSSGTVTTANSLTGTTAGDQVGGGGVTALTNGNYVVISPSWDLGTVLHVGAITWCDGTTGRSGTVTTGNSLHGLTKSDQIGSQSVVALTNGHYVIKSAYFELPTIEDPGALTWGDGTKTSSGPVTSANSLLGAAEEDTVGAGIITPLANGDYLALHYNIANGPIPNASALTYAFADGTTVGAVTATNSVLGTVPGGIGGYAFDPTGNRVIVGRGASRLLTIFTPPTPNQAPTAIQLSNESLNENNPPGGIVGTLTVTDPNLDQNHVLTIVAGEGSEDNALFTIVGYQLRLLVSADFEVKTSYAVRIRATDNGSPARFSEQSFLIEVVNLFEGPAGRGDAATTATGPSVLYPLANDAEPHTTILSVSDPAIIIGPDGRSLHIPAGFTGTFHYVTAADTTAHVTIAAGLPEPSGKHFQGLLRFQGHGSPLGLAKASVSRTGVISVTFATNLSTHRRKITLPPGATPIPTPTKLEEINLGRNADGTLQCSFSTIAGIYSGHLRPIPTRLTTEKYHVALASIDPGIPGGGFLTAQVAKSGAAKLIATLPDGTKFSTSGGLSDNGTIAFHGPQRIGVSPTGIVSGELVLADLPGSDLTGEIAWSKPEQNPRIKGPHLSGLQTLLVANGSRYAGQIPMDGVGMIRLSGGSLASPLSYALPVVAGKPSTGSGLLTTWTAVKSRGTFSAKLQFPGSPRRESASGVYLPKAKRAWGYFPGATQGGRLELSTP